MRRATLPFILWLLATPAHAAVLTSATLTVEVGILPPFTLTSSSVVGTASSNLAVTLAPFSAFAGTTTVVLPGTSVPPITQVQYVLGAGPGGVLTGTSPGDLRGVAPLLGSACVINSFCLVQVPLLFGTTQQTTFTQAGGLIQATGHTWKVSTTTLSLTTPTPTPTPSSPTTTTRQGSNGLTAGGAGTLVLVSGVHVVTGVAGVVPTFATLTLNFVPEPGTALLLLAGAAGALALSRRIR